MWVKPQEESQNVFTTLKQGVSIKFAPLFTQNNEMQKGFECEI
jgi:hypothetical protein